MPGDSDRPPPPRCHRSGRSRAAPVVGRFLPGIPADTRTPSRKPWPRCDRRWWGRALGKGDPEIPAGSSTSSPRRWRRFGKLWRGPRSRSGCRCSRGGRRSPPPPPCRRSRRGLESTSSWGVGGQQCVSRTPPPPGWRRVPGVQLRSHPTSDDHPTQPPTPTFQERTQESGEGSWGVPPPPKKAISDPQPRH